MSTETQKQEKTEKRGGHDVGVDALVMRRLLNDVCRCHDHECLKSQKCLRFLQRDTGNECSVHCHTLRLSGTNQFGCESFIGA